MKSSSTLTILLIGIVLLSVTLVVALSSASQSTWQLADGAAPKELLTQIRQDNLNPDISVDPGQMKVLKIQGSGQSQPLYLIDSRMAEPQPSPLCGAAGCAFFAYTAGPAGYERVFSAYLNPHLPPEQLLIQPQFTLERGLPRLTVHQLEASGLQQFTLAFNGEQYEVVQVEYLPLSHE